MNILIIPSHLEIENWEYLKTIAEGYPDHTFIVCNWGQNSNSKEFDLLRPWKIPAAISQWKNAESYHKNYGTNLIEVYEPTLAIHRTLGSFKMSRIYDACLRLYMRTKINYGKVHKILAYGAYPALGICNKLSNEMNVPYVYFEDRSLKHFFGKSQQNEMLKLISGAKYVIAEKSNCINEFNAFGLHPTEWKTIFE
jgi:hypothetical protein